MLGMVIVESMPSNGGAPPSVLLATITAVAPASCAFFTFVTAGQPPKSIKAIRPVMALPFVMAVHPLDGVAAATVPFKPPTVRCWPKFAALIGYDFASEAGARMLKLGLGSRNFNAAAVVEAPSQTTFWSLIMETRR